MNERLSRIGRGLTTCVLIALVAASAMAADGAPTTVDVPPGPLTLDECVHMALAANPQLVASEQNVIGAEAALTRARSPYYPELTAGLLAAIADDSLGDGTSRTDDASLVVRQTIWQSGLRESVAGSAAQLESARHTYIASVQSLVEQVAADYYGVLAADRLVEVAKAGADSSQQHLEEVQARIEVGLSARVDEATAQDDLARAELSLIDAQSFAKVARAQLKTTLSLPQQTQLELAEPAPVNAREIPTLERALLVAEGNRPDIASAKAAVEASRSAVRQAEIRRGPVSDVSGQYDWGYTDWERRDGSWDVALTLSWPLFDGLATRADVISARASLARSEAQLRSALDQLGLEVESALAELVRARQRVAATEKSVAAAEARMQAAEGKYQQGVGILLEVIDARAALTSAQANQVQAAYDLRTALVALDRVLGILSPPEASEQ